MNYTNETIQKLILERDAIVEKYNRQIQDEINKEKAKYKFSWKRFGFLLLLVVGIPLMYELNKMIFPPDSIFIWEFYERIFTK